MTLRRAIVSNPLCCPSRATIFTGRYSHTTGVYTNLAPDGGWPSFQAFRIRHDRDRSRARWAIGRALIGKYMNGYGGAGAYVPPGWDRWFAHHGAHHLLQLHGLRRCQRARELWVTAEALPDGRDPEQGRLVHPERTRRGTSVLGRHPVRTARDVDRRATSRGSLLLGARTPGSGRERGQRVRQARLHRRPAVGSPLFGQEADTGSMGVASGGRRAGLEDHEHACGDGTSLEHPRHLHIRQRPLEPGASVGGETGARTRSRSAYR